MIGMKHGQQISSNNVASHTGVYCQQDPHKAWLPDSNAHTVNITHTKHGHQTTTKYIHHTTHTQSQQDPYVHRERYLVATYIKKVILKEFGIYIHTYVAKSDT